MELPNIFKKHDEPPLVNGQAEMFLAGVRTEPELHIAFSFALYAGLGENETLALRWEDVDYTAQSVIVYDTRRKTQRTVYIPKKLTEMLKAHKNKQAGRFVVSLSPYLLNK